MSVDSPRPVGTHGAAPPPPAAGHAVLPLAWCVGGEPRPASAWATKTGGTVAAPIFLLYLPSDMRLGGIRLICRRKASERVYSSSGPRAELQCRCAHRGGGGTAAQSDSGVSASEAGERASAAATPPAVVGEHRQRSAPTRQLSSPRLGAARLWGSAPQLALDEDVAQRAGAVVAERGGLEAVPHVLQLVLLLLVGTGWCGERRQTSENVPTAAIAAAEWAGSNGNSASDRGGGTEPAGRQAYPSGGRMGSG